MKVGDKLIQGDVILVYLGSSSSILDNMGATKQKFEKKVLQESEVSGHHHHFMPTALVDLYQDPKFVSKEKTITPNIGKLILVYDTDALLYHGKGFDEVPALKGTGDHKALVVPPGVYEIDIVREYCYASHETARVVD